VAGRWNQAERAHLPGRAGTLSCCERVATDLPGIPMLSIPLVQSQHRSARHPVRVIRSKPDSGASLTKAQGVALAEPSPTLG
jgi:hypothetical protein